MEAVALHTYQTSKDEEFSFEKGSLLKVLDFRNVKPDTPGFYRAELDEKIGLVPSNYVQLKPCEWFKGKLSQAAAEGILSASEQPDGAFLIRDSESTPGDFDVSVKHQNGVQHFKVLRDGVGKYFLRVVKFDSLNELVSYHRTSSVSRTQTIYLGDMVDSKVERVRALYDFEAKKTEDLTFKKGDVILVAEKQDENWWKGELNGAAGTFPKTYVETI